MHHRYPVPLIVFFGCQRHLDARGQTARGLCRKQGRGDWYLISQFESPYARLAFPCFDEPSFKVPWQVTLELKQGDSAFSNTEIVSERDGPDGWRTVSFAETKPL